ncbi:MAG: serine/threonine protein kinase [Sandaracinaceae bacterium]|nr:serine/threonine protein kinase [Sandaracinaceae bacterium]
MTVEPGHVIDGYTIEAALGEGSSGQVFRARAADGSVVALKLLDPELSRHEVIKTRFQREARALNGLDHPHLIRILDYGTHDTFPYIAMELLEGRPLDEIVDERPLPPEMAFELGIGIVAGLAHAHAHGVLHRDLKPENVFVATLPGGGLHPKVIDFGLAKFTNEERWGASETLTEEGALIGTPIYMAPEQGFGKRATEQSDVYSAGVVLFELLAARPPFMKESRSALIRAHLLDPVPKIPQIRPGLVVQPQLEALLEMALAKKAQDRFDSAVSMLRAMQDIPVPAARYL